MKEGEEEEDTRRSHHQNQTQLRLPQASSTLLLQATKKHVRLQNGPSANRVCLPRSTNFPLEKNFPLWKNHIRRQGDFHWYVTNSLLQRTSRTCTRENTKLLRVPSNTEISFFMQIGNEDPAARKAEIEKAKQAQLKGQKQGTNEWDASIASESESIVR